MYPEADLIRLFALGACVVALAFFPAAINHRNRLVRGYRWDTTWVAVFGCCVFLLQAIFSIMDHFGEPLKWYRTPLALVGSTALITFAIITFWRSSGR